MIQLPPKAGLLAAVYSLCVGPPHVLLAESATGPVKASASSLSRQLVLDVLERSKALVADGQYDAAEDLIRPVFQRVAELEGQDLGLAGAVVEILAQALHSAGRDVELADRNRLLELIALQEKALGPHHPALGKVLMELACLSHSWQESPETERLYRRIFEMQEHGGERVAAARTRNYLGILLYEAGELGRAKETYEEALRILYEELGSFEDIMASEEVISDHALVAEVIGSLAMLTIFTGDHGRSQALFDQSNRLYEKVLGPEHKARGYMLFNYAHLLSRTGRMDESIQAMRRALDLWTELLGEDHFYRGLALAALGRALSSVGEWTEAESKLLAALDNLKSTLGPNAYRTAVVHRRLGDLYRRSDRTTEALAHYGKAVAIHDTGPFRDHPEVARNLAETARLLFQEGRHTASFETALEAEKRARAALLAGVDVLAERQAIYVSSDRLRGLDTALTVVAEGAGDVRRAWGGTVRSRSLVFEEMIARRQPADADHPKIRAQVQELAEARRRLSDLYVQVIDRLGHPRHLSEAITRRDAAESALAESSRAFRRRQERRDAGLEDVFRHLPKGEALVAFVRYRHLSTNGSEAIGAPSYLAFVRSSDVSGNGKVAAVPLGAAEWVDQRVDQYLTWMTRHSEARYQNAAKRLREVIWDPVAAALGGDLSRLWIVPDSELHRVQWNALVMDDGSYWVESGPVTHIVSAERDLVSRRPSSQRPTESLLTVGGVDFNARPGLKSAGSRSTGSSADKERRPVDTSGPCSTFSRREFRSLKGSASEARTVAELAREALGTGLSITELTGAQAGEASFRSSAPNSRYLHLATHGYVLDEGCSPVEPPAPGLSAEPFLRSGLVLAGANQRHRARPSEDDGILTAEEIAALDLSGVELVVLSACDTALGRAIPGEGVLGLRRAFRVAGARSLLSSLWPVDDEVAEPWMATFYQGLFQFGLDLPDAAHRAARETLLERRRKGLETHPYFWAPFISEGPL